jgi:TonB family protein
MALIRISKFEEAIRVLSEAVRLKPDWAQAHLNLGVAYIKLKDRQKALEQHEILKKLNPEVAKTLFDIIEEPGKVISGGILNGRALSLPKPSYPPSARAQRVSGVVAVQVTIDEEGNVIAAKAISGHPLLHADSVWAARQARFAPTTLEGKPVKVTGVITYNFVAQ